MIPILFEKAETLFVSNGIGRLSDCIRCLVTEERNGVYECEFDYPITGAHFEEIIPNETIVLVTHDDTGAMEPFDIYKKTAPNLNGVCTFYAHHISYRLNETVVMPFEASSVVETLSKIVPNSVGENPFTFWTDKTTTGDYKNTIPQRIRGMLGGQENSILDVYGKGDYEFTRFDVKLYAERGQDSGVEIRYAKNLTDLSYDKDFDGSYNAVVPYWTNSETGETITLPEKVIVYEGLEPLVIYWTDHNDLIIRTETNEPIAISFKYPYNAVPMDLTDEFQEQPTVEQLRAAANRRFSESGAWEPSETIDVDFVQLWQTDEYKDYAPLQRVRLCDTVTVIYNALGVRAIKKKVIKTTYNVLLDRYDSVELGTPSVSFAEAVRSGLLDEVPTNSMMSAAIKYATEMIRGGLGGYVVMTPGANGYPQEILIMDTPDVNTAVNVWRFNQGGLGHSHNGYQGPFSDVALTQDGKINASMITTGAMNANLITTGVLNADLIKSGTITLAESGLNAAELVLADEDGNKVGSLDTDGALFFRHANPSRTIIEKQTYGNSIRFAISVDGHTTRYTERAFLLGADYDDYGQYPYLPYGDLTYDNAFEITYGEQSGGLIFPHKILHLYGTKKSTDFTSFDPSIIAFENTLVYADFRVTGNLTVNGTKNRLVKTQNYGERLNYCYETPTPLFGDIGEAVLDADGICYVDIDDIFSETIELRQEYQVFLQKEGEGDCWVADKQKRYFVIKGTPNLKVAWELKAKQRDYDMIRLEQPFSGLDEYEKVADEADSLLDSYITEQEEILYG